jgi:hypothetical protein
MIVQKDVREQRSARGRVAISLMGAHPAGAVDQGPREALPQAVLVQLEPAGAIRPHFHPVQQFQIAVGGDGRIGREPWRPGDVHYSDPYTAYGPISGSETGLQFITLRKEYDFGAYYMPESRHVRAEQLAAGRTGQQRSVTVATLATAAGTRPSPRWRTCLEDEDGMTVKAAAPTGTEPAPPASVSGSGAFIVVVTGCIRTAEAMLEQGSIAFVPAGESTPALVAVPDAGAVNVCLLQFPHAA